MRKGWGHSNRGKKRSRREVARHSSGEVIFSEYKAVWLVALFDLPTTEQWERKEYSRFRKLLLDEGFSMMQFSVYARFFRSEESGEPSKNLIRANLPSDGQVRLLTVTDRQFGKMEIFYGKKRKEPEESPRQLVLF